MSGTPPRRRSAPSARWGSPPVAAKETSMRSLRPSCCNTRFAWRRDLRRVGTAAGAAVLLACGGSGAPHGPYARVTIPPGTSFRAAAVSLHRAGFVEFPFAFRLYARATGRDRDIKAGTYVLQRDL